MTFPNALFLAADAWRARQALRAPCGGLTPMGIHAIDGMIDLCGDIEEVYCQSFRRTVEIDADDTTSMLFRMKAGMSGYLGDDDGNRRRIQLPGLRRPKGYVQTGGHDPHRRRTFRRAAQEVLRRPVISSPSRVRCEHWKADEVDIVQSRARALRRCSQWRCSRSSIPTERDDSRRGGDRNRRQDRPPRIKSRRWSDRPVGSSAIGNTDRGVFSADVVELQPS